MPDVLLQSMPGASMPGAPGPRGILVDVTASASPPPPATSATPGAAGTGHSAVEPALCECCEECTAEVYCQDCEEHLCSECATEVHHHKKKKGHKMVPVGGVGTQTPVWPSASPPTAKRRKQGHGGMAESLPSPRGLEMDTEMDTESDSEDDSAGSSADASATAPLVTSDEGAVILTEEPVHKRVRRDVQARIDRFSITFYQMEAKGIVSLERSTNAHCVFGWSTMTVLDGKQREFADYLNESFNEDPWLQHVECPLNRTQAFYHFFRKRVDRHGRCVELGPEDDCLTKEQYKAKKFKASYLAGATSFTAR